MFATQLAARANVQDVIDEFGTFLKTMERGDVEWEGRYKLRSTPPAPDAALPELPPPAAGIASKQFNMQVISVFGYTTEAGEPLTGGMKNTAWQDFKAAAAGRVVLQTFGSDYDTLLAAYTGAKLTSLKRIAFSDNKVVTGLPGGGSLIQFDVTAGAGFHVQIGSKTGDEGDLYLSHSLLPPGGGLVAQLQTLGGFTYVGRDYNCPLGAGGLTNCPVPAFLVYNASDKVLSVVASSTLGAGVVAPPAFTLKPGQAVLKSFTFGPGFDKTTVRNVAGLFRFSGMFNGSELFRSDIAGLINVRDGATLPDVLKLVAAPAVRAALSGDFTIFPFDITNTAATAARGCTVQGENQGYTNVLWRAYDPASLKTSGVVNPLMTIAPGATAHVAVAVARLQSTAADPSFGAHIEVHCANTANARVDLSNRIDVTAVARIAPAILWVDTGATTLVNVPATGAVFTARTTNYGPSVDLTARPLYVAPFGETDPKKQFAVAICPATATTAACLASTNKSLAFVGTTNTAVAFKIAVKPPATDPGFDAGARRVFLQIEQSHPDIGAIPVGSASVAVRKH